MSDDQVFKKDDYCVMPNRTFHYPMPMAKGKPDISRIPALQLRVISSANPFVTDEDLQSSCQSECDSDGQCVGYSAFYHTADIRNPINASDTTPSGQPKNLQSYQSKSQTQIAKISADAQYARCPELSKDRCVPQCVIFQEEQVKRLDNVMNKEMLSTRVQKQVADTFFSNYPVFNQIAPGTQFVFKNPTLC